MRSGLTWLIWTWAPFSSGGRLHVWNFSVFAVELRDAALKLHAEPEVLVLVEAHAENAGRRVRLQQRDRVLGDLAGLRIELAEDLFAEARVPRHALRIDDHVVRLARALRQVVLGVDDLRRLALSAAAAS